MDTPQLVLQQERGGQQRPVVVVLILDPELLAEVAELEGRTQGMIFDEQQVVLEKDLIVPNQLVIESLPVEPEQDDDQENQENDVFFCHKRRSESSLFISPGQVGAGSSFRFDLSPDNTYF